MNIMVDQAGPDPIRPMHYGIFFIRSVMCKPGLDLPPSRPELPLNNSIYIFQSNTIFFNPISHKGLRFLKNAAL